VFDDATLFFDVIFDSISLLFVLAVAHSLLSCSYCCNHDSIFVNILFDLIFNNAILYFTAGYIYKKQ